MTGPDPRVAAARTAVRRECSDLPEGSLVLVACSGGADSLALAAATAFVAPRQQLRAGAVVVDHGWHPGSGDVASGAASQCRELGLDPVEVVTVHAAHKPGGRGPEASARDARYAALAESADRLGAGAVLLGHTREDQAETVLLGLVRGSGTRSLAGMPRRRGVLRRPFLDLPRADVHATCAVLGLEPWTDPANSDPAMLRTRVRDVVLPVLERELGPGVAAALARSAALLRADGDALDALAAGVLEAAVREGDGVQLDVETLAAAPEALRRRALRQAALRAGAPAGDLSMAHVLAVEGLLTDWHGQGPVHLPGRVVVRRSCGRLSLAVDLPQQE
jgi:tRNA(Ile)-lysidine synthase